MGFDAAILDVDGVLTRTEVVHERAWKELLDELLRGRGDPRPFSHEDYRDHVDGKPRLAGLRDFLASRGIELAPREIEALADRKNGLFEQHLRERGVEVYDDAVDQVRAWRSRGLGVAFVSSSRNARRVLEAAGILELCDVEVDGETAAALGLDGKPDLFREAARRLDVERPRAFVVEDAVAGVEAAAQAGFGLVVGVSRNGDGSVLAAHGAEKVVRRLDELGELAAPGMRRARALPSALRFEAIEARIGARRPAVFLDFDGTLAPIVPHPADARLPDETRETLRALAGKCVLGVVSGRDREDVARRVGLPGLWYVGSHGFDIAAPDGRTSTVADGEPALAELDAAEARLRDELRPLPGIVIERKRFALAVHYRLASDADGQRATCAVRAAAAASALLRTHVDLRVVELRPRLAWDKGRVVRHLLAQQGETGTLLPIYVGDGHTDEDAFRGLRHAGLTILVGAPLRPTYADLRLEGPDDVRRLLDGLSRWLDARGALSSWSLRFSGWAPERQRHREALCTLGNGCFATRGAAEEARADGVHYPGTYLAGGYDRIATEIRGEVLVNEDLVNWPNWLPVTFRPAGGEWLSLALFDVLAHEQELDLRSGVLRRRLRVRDREGRVTTISSLRFVSMDDPHVAALRWEIVPESWSGPVEIRSALDGSVTNAGVERYRALRGEHLVTEQTGGDDERAWIAVRSRQSGLRVAEAARTRVVAGGDVRRELERPGDRVGHRFELLAAPGEPIAIEKVVAVHTARDPATSDPLDDACARLQELPPIDVLRAAHERKWMQLWDRCDIYLGREHEEANRILRLHVFHLLQVISPHIADRDVGVPARGLHGEAYRGHVFWDELFIFPFLNYSVPELTRELLMYRYRRLDAARAIAQASGHAGALYPWQSGSSGREESQVLHLNPRSGRWVPDETRRQWHIGAAVAFNVWQYFEATGDREFLSFYGAEMLLEIARFWGSAAAWDEAIGRYRIRGVMGPDEFHTGLPGATTPGLVDNAYTNVMAAWCLLCAERALGELGEDRQRELLEALEIGEEERARWASVARRLRVPFQAGGLISQFDGYEGLEELDWARYEERYGDVQRLDRILEAEGDTPNRYKASKQADVLMLFFLFSADELTSLLRTMGYTFDPQTIPAHVEYYLRRTSHGSTLSGIVHSWVLARSDRAHSWRLLRQALQADVGDVQGGTTAEGIHLGAMASTVDLVRRGYTGAVIRDGVLWLAPQLPEEVGELQTRFRFRGAWLDARIRPGRLELEFPTGEARTVRVGVHGEVHELSRGERRSFPI